MMRGLTILAMLASIGCQAAAKPPYEGTYEREPHFQMAVADILPLANSRGQSDYLKWIVELGYLAGRSDELQFQGHHSDEWVYIGCVAGWTTILELAKEAPSPADCKGPIAKPGLDAQAGPAFTKFRFILAEKSVELEPIGRLATDAAFIGGYTHGRLSIREERSTLPPPDLMAIGCREVARKNHESLRIVIALAAQDVLRRCREIVLAAGSQ